MFFSCVTDHRPVKLVCAFAKTAPASLYQTCNRKAVRPDRPVTDEERSRVRQAPGRIPWFSWNLDVDLHCEGLAAAWCEAGEVLSPPKHTKPINVKPYVTEQALHLIGLRKALQRYLRHERSERQRRLCLIIVLAAFCQYTRGACFTPTAREIAAGWLAAIDYSEAVAWGLYRWYGLRLRELVAAGKRAYLQRLVDDAASCTLRNPAELYASIRRAFPTAKSARRSSLVPLPMLLGPDGEPVLSSADREACWRGHFAEQEAGTTVTAEQYVSALQHRHVPQGVFDICVVPTLAQAEQVILRLQNGKAAGADQITAELLSSQPLTPLAGCYR